MGNKYYGEASMLDTTTGTGMVCPYGQHHEIKEDTISKYWLLNEKLHREDGPAIEYFNGNKEWFSYGELHREDGPASVYTDGTKYWYKNGQIHREGGPAVEFSNGDKYWYFGNKFHCDNGPSVILTDGHKEWYLHGVRYFSKKDYLKHISFKNKIQYYLKSIFRRV